MHILSNLLRVSGVPASTDIRASVAAKARNAHVVLLMLETDSAGGQVGGSNWRQGRTSEKNHHNIAFDDR